MPFLFFFLRIRECVSVVFFLRVGGEGRWGKEGISLMMDDGGERLVGWLVGWFSFFCYIPT